jgi:hypothetical protein
MLELIIPLCAIVVSVPLWSIAAHLKRSARARDDVAIGTAKIGFELQRIAEQGERVEITGTPMEVKDVRQFTAKTDIVAGQPVRMEDDGSVAAATPDLRPPPPQPETRTFGMDREEARKVRRAKRIEACEHKVAYGSLEFLPHDKATVECTACGGVAPIVTTEDEREIGEFA